MGHHLAESHRIGAGVDEVGFGRGERLHTERHAAIRNHWKRGAERLGGPFVRRFEVTPGSSERCFGDPNTMTVPPIAWQASARGKLNRGTVPPNHAQPNDHIVTLRNQ